MLDSTRWKPVRPPKTCRKSKDFQPLRRALVPCFDGFYGNVIDLIADKGPSSATRILDIGAGTGLISALIRQKWPNVALHLLDGSQAMLDEARRRFTGDPLVSYTQADMTQAALNGPWDIIVSALAIHHLDDAEKRALFRRVYDALQPGGWFINAEQVSAPSKAGRIRDRRIWAEQAQNLGATQADIDAAEQRMRHDRCATLDDQLAWLWETGFTDVDCTFKAWQFAVFLAVRG